MLAEHRMTAVLAALTIAAGLLLAGCGKGYGAYCGTVTSSQQQLSNAFSEGGPAALLAALPDFKRLQAKAPGDIRGDWDQLVTAVQGLQQALQAAGVDPSTYAASKLPAGLGAAQTAAIKAAATELESQTTLGAAQAVDQEARDVCHTPLSL